MYMYYLWPFRHLSPYVRACVRARWTHGFSKHAINVNESVHVNRVPIISSNWTMSAYYHCCHHHSHCFRKCRWFFYKISFPLCSFPILETVAKSSDESQSRPTSGKSVWTKRKENRSNLHAHWFLSIGQELTSSAVCEVFHEFEISACARSIVRMYMVYVCLLSFLH